MCGHISQPCMLQPVSPLPDLCSPPVRNRHMVYQFLACDPFLKFFATAWYLLLSLLVDLNSNLPSLVQIIRSGIAEESS
ncbi:hypothetical protein GYH30_045205 [Glycine max]|uniref:Uncharacterized protein n=1 Tax=Glycine max TaxID=3847 RepID=A0A0R0G1V0_SOYBN|nr:hypothetical protein GYH30_045205 [Glycine max]